MKARQDASLNSRAKAGVFGTRWPWLILAAAVVGAAGFVVWAVGESYRARDRTAARRLVEAGAFEDALGVIETRWLVSEPRSGEAHFFLGRALLGLDRPQEALSVLEKARSLGYPEPELERIVGIVLARSGRLAQAQTLLERDLARNPRPDAERDEALARLYGELYRFGPAFEAVARWSQADPDDEAPYLFRAQLSTQTSAGADRLADDYRDALRRNSSSLAARMGLAEALRSQGQYGPAIAEYEAFLQRKPDDAVALAGAGLAALADGQEDRATQLLDAALKADASNTAALDGRASIALRHRDYERALGWIDQALVNEPLNSELHYRRGLALDGLKRADEARTERETTARLRREAAELDDLRKKLLRAPRDIEIQSQLALWLVSRDRAEEGLIWAERVLASPGRHSDVANAVADYYDRQGNTARANYYRALAGS